MSYGDLRLGLWAGTGFSLVYLWVLSKIWVGSLGSSLCLHVLSILSSLFSLHVVVCLVLLYSMLCVSIGMSDLSSSLFLFVFFMSCLSSLSLLSSIYKRRNIRLIYLVGGPSWGFKSKMPPSTSRSLRDPDLHCRIYKET